MSAVLARLTAFTDALKEYEGLVFSEGVLEGLFLVALGVREPDITNDIVQVDGKPVSNAAMEARMAADPTIVAARLAVTRGRLVVLAHVRALILGEPVDAAHLAEVAAGKFDTSELRAAAQMRAERSK